MAKVTRGNHISFKMTAQEMESFNLINNINDVSKAEYMRGCLNDFNIKNFTFDSELLKTSKKECNFSFTINDDELLKLNNIVKELDYSRSIVLRQILVKSLKKSN